MVGRGTFEPVGGHVVENRMRRPDRMAQRQGLGRRPARLRRLEDADREQRAILAILAVLLVRAARHVCRHRRHSLPCRPPIFLSRPRRHQRGHSRPTVTKTARARLMSRQKSIPYHSTCQGTLEALPIRHIRQWTIGFLIWSRPGSSTDLTIRNLTSALPPKTNFVGHRAMSGSCPTGNMRIGLLKEAAN